MVSLAHEQRPRGWRCISIQRLLLMVVVIVLSLWLSFCLLLQCTAAFYLFASSVRTGVIVVVILFVVTMYRSFFFYLCASGFRCWDRRHIVVISYVVTMYCSFFYLCLWFSMFGQASFLNEREVMRRTARSVSTISCEVTVATTCSSTVERYNPSPSPSKKNAFAPRSSTICASTEITSCGHDIPTI